MKKKISMFLAAVMIITLLPAMGVFAATSNSISSTPQLPKDYDFGKNAATAPPILAIEGKANSQLDATQASFRLTLENAEWSFVNDAGTGLGAGAAAYMTEKNGDMYAVEAGKSTYTTDAGAADQQLNYYIERLSDKMINVVLRGDLTIGDADFYNTTATATAGMVNVDNYIYIPLLTKLTDEGTAKVTIGGGTTTTYGINTGEYSFAVVSEGATKVSIGGTVDFADVGNLKTIIIDEVIPGTFKDGELKITAPSGFEWATPLPAWGADGISGSGITIAQGASAPHYEKYGNDNTDKSVLVIPMEVTKTTSKVGSIRINGLKIIAEDDDSKKGDVFIKFKGIGMTAEEIKIGAYVSYDITLTAEDKELPVLVSGQYPSSATDDTIETLKVKFKEQAADAWSPGRKTTFTFPEGVKPRAVEISGIKNLTDTNLTNKTLVNVDLLPGNAEGTTGTGTWKLDDDGLTIRRESVVATKKAEFEMQFYLSVEPGFEGDITCTVGGEAIANEATATIATAVNPFTVETAATQYPIGLKNLEVADIVIKETVAGAIQKSGANIYDEGKDTSSDSFVVAIEDMNVQNNTSKVEITDGDLVVEKIAFNSAFFATTGSTSNKALDITIKRESTTPSTMKITDTLISIDRTLPQGDYELRIGGNVCANYSDKSKLIDATFDKSYFVGKEDYVSVTTSSGYEDVGYKTTVKVTIGSKELIAGEETITMDVAPFIEGGFTYIPLSAVAKALGLGDNAVQFTAVDKSIMIYTTSRTAKLVANSNKIIINGIENTIESPVLIRENRTFVPFRVLGEQILGVTVSWFEDSRTAQFN